MKLGEAIVAFKANAATAASLNGFKASEVLSTLDNPTSAFTIPVGVLITGLVKVLFVKVSAPANVANVPEAGSVTFVAAEVVNTVLNPPAVSKFPANVIVLPVLSTPVPPFAPRTTPVTLAAFPPEIAELTKSLTALLLGYLISDNLSVVKSAANVRFALSCFKFKAACVNVLIGLAKSDVLSTEPKPTFAFTIPVGFVI